MIGDPRSAPPRIFRDGRFVDERDLMSDGNPQPQTGPELTEEWTPVQFSDHWSAVIDHVCIGVNERLREGRHEGQAWALCSTDYDRVLESDIYGLVPEADIRQFDQFDTNKPIPVREMTGAAAAERAERRAAARATMKADERSPLDMIQIARSLRADAQARERTWQKQLELLELERRQDQEAVELYQKWERGKKVIERERKK